jgi:hypothetical protein
LYPESFELPPPLDDFNMSNPNLTYDKVKVPKGFQRRYVIRTRPIRCDKNATLYKLNDKERKSFTQAPAEDCDRYVSINLICEYV